MNSKHKKEHPIYEPPQAISLSGLSGIGQYVTMGTCHAGMGPGYCLTGTAPVDECHTGNAASAFADCRNGNGAASQCMNGNQVYSASCRAGTRPYNCATGSRA